MQKKPIAPKRPAGAASGGIVKKAPAPPPKPMVTALQRKEIKEQRRAPVSGSSGSIGATRPPTTAAWAAAPAAGTPSEALQDEAARFSSLQNELLLTSINDDIGDIDAAVAALPGNLENIRARGYVFKSYLEKKVETLTAQWQETRPRVAQAVETQQRSLQTDATNVQNTLNRRQSASLALTSLEGKVNAAQSSLRGMYDNLDDNINQTQQQIDDVSWTMQQAEQASYGFLPTEAPVEAVPANWKKPGDNDGVDGVLLLTDQRLLFEQKEEVATKKVLFITTEKQKIQALNWQIPVAQIEQAVGSKKGFMGKDDFLTVTCSRDGAFQDANGSPLYVPGVGGKMTGMELHLKGETGEAWQGFIGRVKSKEIEKERTVPVDEAAVEAAAAAPTKCPTCGATLNQTVLRGQTEMKCEFCGSVIRL
jgi:hypothetical protein